MAYDATDPADQAILAAAVAEALETAEAAHDAEVERLKNKNTELLGKLAKARKGEGADTGEVERLERELEDTGAKLTTAQADLRQVKRDLAKVEQERDSAKTTLVKETEISRNMVVDSSLTSALVEANVAPQFLEAAKALLGKGVAVKETDGERTAFVGDKPLGEFVKEWATCDAGKAFIKAPANGGGGGNNLPNGQGGSKKLSEMSEVERTEMATNNPAAWTALLAENNMQPTA